MKLDDCKIDAWLCPICADVVTFGFKRHYLSCLSVQRRQRKYMAERAKLEEFLNAPRLYSTSPQDFVERINYGVYALWNCKPDLRIIGLRYSTEVTNSAVSPVGVSTNWCHQDRDQPFYFQGYYIKYMYNQRALEFKRWPRHAPIFKSDILTKFYGLHFGGGSIGYNWGEAFLQDFPRWNKTPGFYITYK